MSQPPTQKPFDENGNPDNAWIEWALNVTRNLKYKGSDTTANRPTNGLTDGDWYLDTTLGYPIWYYGSVWINSAGTTV